MASAILVLGAALGVSGCDSTQSQSARAQVQATRLLASRRVVRVGARDPHVAVVSASLVRGTGRGAGGGGAGTGRGAGGAGAAIVVRLRNDGTAAVNDLPLSAGVRPRSGRVRLLNRRAGLPYFQTHAPAIAPGATATWVFVTRAAVPAGVRAWAEVGVTRGALPTAAPGPLPRIVATVAGNGSTRVTVRNESPVPQYGLDVYVWARRGGRVVAAGRAQIAHLGTHASTIVPVRLTGDARGARLSVDVPPTLFR